MTPPAPAPAARLMPFSATGRNPKVLFWANVDNCIFGTGLARYFKMARLRLQPVHRALAARAGGASSLDQRPVECAVVAEDEGSHRIFPARAGEITETMQDCRRPFPCFSGCWRRPLEDGAVTKKERRRSPPLNSSNARGSARLRLQPVHPAHAAVFACRPLA